MDGSGAATIHDNQNPFPPWGPVSEQTASWEDEKVPLGDGSLPAHSYASSPPEKKEGTALPQPQKAVFLKVLMVKQRTSLPDPQLQDYLKRRLRLLENDSKKATAVFSELSARLLSIHSEDHLIAVTFWTLEEIWKFITYYSLGFVNHCMENLLLDDCFWLSSPEEAAGIDVLLDEERLNMVYRSLLIQEGSFFVFSPENGIEERAADDQTVARIDPLKLGALIPSRGASERDGLVKGFGEPLIPFHQWFLKANPDPQGFARLTEIPVTDQTATGFATAVISHDSMAPEEISFQEGDKIEIIGYFMSCMQWFLGRHTSTACTGFVQSSSVKPDGFTTVATECPHLDFFKDYYSFFAKEKELSEDDLVGLLTQTAHDNICSMYQIDAQNDIGLPKPPEQEMPHSIFAGKAGPTQLGVVQSLMERKDFQPTEDQSEPPCPCPSTGEDPPSAQQPRFCLGRDGISRPERFDALLLFLNRDGYDPAFSGLYDPSFAFLHTLFHGYAAEEDLVGYLTSAREAAKRAKVPWALARLCYLLGRMSIRKSKLSQARVYFEEAVTTLQGDFGDLDLIASLYTNLTGIYLKQNNKEKCASFLDKAASLLMGRPTSRDSSKMASEILKHALKRALIGQSPSAEARGCFLLAKHCLSLQQGDEALPFLERMQLLNKDLGVPPGGLLANVYIKLGQLYSRKCLPYLALSCVKAASSGSPSSCPLQELFRSVDLVLRNAPKLHGPKTAGQTHPPQMAFHLQELLGRLEAGGGSCKLRGILCRELSRLYGGFRRYKEAIGYMEKALGLNPPAGMEGTADHLLSLSWLYILHQKYEAALGILNALAESAQTSHRQLGITQNMAGISWRQLGCPRRAAENYAKALRVSREMGSVANEAVALANLGILCLHLAAEGLGEHFLVRAVQLFSELPSGQGGGPFVAILLRLGSFYARGVHKEKGRCCYEWAFLVAMETNNLEGQLQAVGHLCHFYSAIAPDPVQCVLYSEYQLTLVRKLSDKVMEGQVLETISHLYLSLGTERAYRSALDYIKRSLGIFIDLQAKEKEALAWLQAGKIYYVLRESELVDVYIQVAINAALGTQDPNLEMEMLEASGDIFFNGAWEKEKAVPFYRDKALPLAVKAKNGSAELRLFNKLVGLLLTLQKYEECLGYAQTSLMLSVSSGNQLSERVAYHRLAIIHRQLGQCELAEHFFLKAVSLCPSPLEFDEEALYYVKVYLLLADMTFYDLKVRQTDVQEGLAPEGGQPASRHLDLELEESRVGRNEEPPKGRAACKMPRLLK